MFESGATLIIVSYSASHKKDASKDTKTAEFRKGTF